MRATTTSATNDGTAIKSTARRLEVKVSGDLMSLLSNIYTNREKAVLREYACNARDSHVESGQTRPIEITLPTPLQPTLLIQDWGLGLSEDALFTVFGTYNESTKNDDDTTVGGFGIGSKSAYTMGQQFVVTGIKDGIKTVALFSKDEDGLPIMEVVKTLETSEPNGVLVSLAVEDVETMNREADEFFTTWPKGTVLVNGHEPEVSIFDQARKVNESTFLIPDHQGKVAVVMGSVVYPVDRSILLKVSRSLEDTIASEQAKALVDWSSDTSVYFQIGITNNVIAPNRESLRDTPKMIGILSDLVLALATDLTASVQNAVDAESSPYRAAQALQKALEELGDFKVQRSAIQFGSGNKVATFTKEVKVDMPVHFLANRSWRSTTLVVANERQFHSDVKRAAKTLVVVVPPGEETSVTRYVKRFLENEETPYSWVIATDQAKGAFEWFEWGVGAQGVDTWTREEYKAFLKKDAASNPRTKNEPSYSTGIGATASRDLDDRDLLTDIISWGKDIVIFHDAGPRGPFAAEVYKDVTPVILLGTQSEKALRKRVDADGSVAVVEIDQRKAYTAAAQSILNSFTDGEKEALAATTYLKNMSWGHTWGALSKNVGLDNITSKNVLDVFETFELVQMLADGVTKARADEWFAATRWISNQTDLLPDLGIDIPELEEKFPMISSLLTRPWEVRGRLKSEVIEYLNSK